MSKGSPIVLLRVKQEVLDQIDAAVARSVDTRHDEPYTRSSWIMSAILAKLDHPARAKRSKEKRRAKQ